MRRIEFGASRRKLSAALYEAVKKSLADDNIVFDQARFEKHTSIDVNQLSNELMFFGADRYPKDASADDLV